MTWSDAPQEPAAPTRVGRARALEVDSEPTIPLAVPDVGEGLSERVTQDQRRIIPGHPRRNAAGEHVAVGGRSEEHTSELQSRLHLVCRLLLEKKKKNRKNDLRPGHNIRNVIWPTHSD